MITPDFTSGVTTMPKGVGGAEGVGRSHWFVAIVTHNTEKKVAERLDALGYDTYVAIQPEYRVWRNGKRKLIDRVVIPSMVFIRCTERERLTIVSQPFIHRFLTNRAGSLNQYGKPVAIIPPYQIETLRFMLGQSDNPVAITDRTYAKGDRVRVIRGCLRGLQGIVVATADGRSELHVGLDILGCATVTIAPIDIEPLMV